AYRLFKSTSRRCRKTSCFVHNERRRAPTVLVRLDPHHTAETYCQILRARLPSWAQNVKPSVRGGATPLGQKRTFCTAAENCYSITLSAPASSAQHRRLGWRRKRKAHLPRA